MKKLSFLELEREMAKENRIITDEEELKAIEGGRQSGMDRHMGFATTNPFGFNHTTIVNENGVVHSPTTNPNGDSIGLIDGYYGINYYNTEGYSTTTIPLNADQVELYQFIFNQLLLYGYYSSTDFYSGYDNVPDGYHIATDENSSHLGEYWTTVTKDNGETTKVYSYGVTYARGTDANGLAKTKTFISPKSVETFSEERLLGTVGHEAVHNYNIRAHQEMYQNDFDQFKCNSEYAAWKFDYKYYLSIGNQNLANKAQQQMGDIEDNANANNMQIDKTWDWQLPSQFISTTGYPSTTMPSTTMPTTTLIPSTTI